MKLTNKVYHLRKAYDGIDGTYTPIETFDDFVDRELLIFSVSQKCRG